MPILPGVAPQEGVNKVLPERFKQKILVVLYAGFVAASFRGRLSATVVGK